MKKDRDDLQRYVDELTVFLPLPFCTVNPLHLILAANQAFQKLAGYGEMEIIGNEMDSLFVDKKEINKFKESVSKEKERITREAWLLTKDGKRVPVSISALARRDAEGNFLGYFLTILDISEIKEFQGKLEEKVKEKTKELEGKTKEIVNSRRALVNILEETDEARKRTEAEKNKTMAVIRNFPDGLIVFDENGAIDMVNPKAEKFLNMDSVNLTGKKIEDLKKEGRLTPLIEMFIDSGKFGEEIEKEGRAGSRMEMEIVKGQTLEVSIIPVVTGERRIGTLVALHDISREKMIEAMKSEFVSITAHQLRTPLSAIKWTMRMLLDGDLGKLNEEQMDLANKAYTSNERMVNLVNDLLNVSRIEEGRYLYKPELLHIENIIEPLIKTHEPEIEKREIEFEFKKPKEKTPAVAIDNEKMTLVVQNFLDNAMKYTSKGGKIILSVSHDEKTNRVQVSVKDSGVGIPKDQQSRLFSKFFRATNVVRMETEGSGLGLFICKNIIEAHEGKIWFESKEGEGSTFYFDLPVKDRKGFEDFLKKL